jgi:hypothetical protein
VLVIPGNIAFLDQFFQVMLLVSNVAPAGSQLVVTSAHAELMLPLGDDGQASTADDPLIPARTEQFPDGTLTCDVLNRNSGAPELGPGEDAQGEFLVEGKQVGTHRLKVTIEAELRLPTGQTVPLHGTVFGTVVVRDPSFALTLNHPDVVRAGETYTRSYRSAVEPRQPALPRARGSLGPRAYGHCRATRGTRSASPRRCARPAAGTPPAGVPFLLHHRVARAL